MGSWNSICNHGKLRANFVVGDKLAIRSKGVFLKYLAWVMSINFCNLICVLNNYGYNMGWKSTHNWMSHILIPLKYLHVNNLYVGKLYDLSNCHKPIVQKKMASNHGMWSLNSLNYNIHFQVGN